MKRVLLVLLLAACPGPGPKTETKPVVVETPDAAPAPVEPDDGMAIEGALGELDAAAVQPIIEAKAGEIDACFRAEANSKRFIGGRVSLRFRVGREGNVIRVQIEDGDVGSWPVEKCLLALGRQMTLPKPKGGEGEVSFPLDFPAQRDAEAADGDLAKQAGTIGDCGAVKGPITATVYIGVGGKLQSIGFATPAKEPFGDEWGDCVAKKAAGWKFADPKGKIKKLSAVLVE